MKRTISILLLLVFFYQWVGYLLSFKLLQLYQKVVIQSQISSQNYHQSDCKLLKIHISKQDSLYWEEEDKEFIYQNKWYDVINSFTVEDTTYIYCLHDVIEQKFVKHFEQSTHSQWGISKIEIAKLLQIENYFSCLVQETYYPICFTQIYLANWTDKIFCTVIEKHCPPPQT